MIGLTDLV